jgi:hypothetical protein
MLGKASPVKAEHRKSVDSQSHELKVFIPIVKCDNSVAMNENELKNESEDLKMIDRSQMRIAMTKLPTIARK